MKLRIQMKSNSNSKTEQIERGQLYGEKHDEDKDEDQNEQEETDTLEDEDRMRMSMV